MIKKLKRLLNNQNLTHRLVAVEWEDSQRPLSAWNWLDDCELPIQSYVSQWAFWLPKIRLPLR